MLTLDELSKSYGGQAILDRVSWSMNDDDRVALVGLNGAGKSTLLKIIGGAVEPDSGRVSRPQRTRVGYLAQDAPEMGGRTLIDETLSALVEMRALDERRRELEQMLAEHHRGPLHDTALAELGDVLTDLEHHDYYTAESRAEAILFGLGFGESDLQRDVAEFSGGIRMRVALARLLLQRPDFLMLDEPTNHLDIEARNWLEEYLEAYPGGIILVSHDRYFLDRVSRRTVDLARARLIDYAASYSVYLVQREERFERERAAYENQREEIERIEAFISRFRYQASKASLVQSRVKQLEKIERLQPPAGSEKPPAIRFPACARSGRQVLELKRAVKHYGEKLVYSGIDLAIERGARIALVGPNGSGKSTLMKLLAGIEPLTAGARIAGSNVSVGYFAQNLSDALDYGRTLVEELSAGAEGMTAGEVRSLLGAMLFSGDDALKRAGVLSGGERARLALAKVLAHRNNCLLLDEPTNNLDIVAKDTLLEALQRFPGTVVIVSHDRHILNALVTEVVEVGNGHAIRYLGNYDDYLAKKQTATPTPLGSRSELLPLPAATKPGPEVRNGGVAQPRLSQTARDEKRRRDEVARIRAQLEAEIERKESERAVLADEMDDPNFYLTRKDADEMIRRYESLGCRIEELYDELARCENGAANPDDCATA